MSWDPVWEEVFTKQEWGKYPGEDTIRFIARNFYKAPQRNEVKILEVGCGPGANLWYIAREGFRVYGIDGSETAVKKAEERLNIECPQWQGEVRVGDFSKLPYPDQYFDAVIDNEAIYCNSFDDSVGIYQEISRVTKKGGKLFSRTFAAGCWGDGTGQKVGHNAYLVSEGPLYQKGYSRFTTLEEIPELISGFKISEIQLLSRKVIGEFSVERDIKEWIISGEKE
ncbi:class I SAM-dependent methyltransferase [Brevibacillus porteri]|uniref:Class I SAM-dependent methyltransferase n=1 Tax=Brevibacillus porteri TaxID=2126350 RepID=A0ABX5FNJ3_9BACL|nr:class I SAM-dependent methyltransferase [Brevibacillus porteri]MED1801457.1 class I SAM-dependent methyltransferase [Brevibacillus porteri]MED2133840.1 class I SAM-dependent methyltransferase [Brevibacillus porteri]MED2748246.1 class I SAM-dependent methyltransferase [Brevibacillus porteri]MED2815384.1 class I SAM-dependent methyltransferase [Brevibacillus porteri]MED2894809.1 class I SAM-dependent methyltransferase [Brevibacillus porteri]